jgi:hypothetical protein
MGTAQRNLAAAVLVFSLDFAGTMTLPLVVVASIVLPPILIPVARRLGKPDGEEVPSGGGAAVPRVGIREL